MNQQPDPPDEYASSPCYQHEFEQRATAVPPMNEVARQLNVLLEGERAGTRGLIDMQGQSDPELAQLLDAVARDEARFCAMLTHHLERLGFKASRETGVFYAKLAARETLNGKLLLLDRGQSAVVRMLDELMPAIRDQALYADLIDMRETHVRNIEACAAYLQPRKS